MRASLVLLVALVAGACSLDRTGIGAVESSLDADLPDAGPDLDAAPVDGDLPDASVDADLPDAPPDAGSDAGPCVPGAETCDLTDEDCDGLVDEDACGCRSFEHGGHVYQDCPYISGLAAWSGACRRLGPGYDLVVIETAEEDAAIEAATPEPVWLGLNDFDANGSYVWVDRSTAGYVGTWLGAEGTREWESCFAMHSGGQWDDFSCAATLRVLCEGDPADRCVTTDRTDATCDGVDDDCDGAVDEECDLGAGCTSFTFWDRVYLACTTPHTFEGARAACSGAGYALATIDSATEDDAVGDAVGDAWLGLRQGDDPATPDAGWRWVDGSASAYRGWGGGEPNDSNGSENAMEDCAQLRSWNDWADVACSTSIPFLCRRSFAD